MPGTLGFIDILRFLQAALKQFNPFIPQLTFIKLFLDIGDFMKAAAQADLPGIGTAANNILNDFGLLVGLNPAVAFPKMVIGYLIAIQMLMRQLQTRLRKIANSYTAVNATIARLNKLGGNLAALNAAQCAKKNLDAELLRLVGDMGVIAVFFIILNGILKLIPGAPCLPLIPAVSATNIDVVLAAFDTLVNDVQIVIDVLKNLPFVSSSFGSAQC